MNGRKDIKGLFANDYLIITTKKRLQNDATRLRSDIDKLKPLCVSYKLDPPRSKEYHLEQQPAMVPPADVGGAIGAFPVTKRHLHDL